VTIWIAGLHACGSDGNNTNNSTVTSVIYPSSANSKTVDHAKGQCDPSTCLSKIIKENAKLSVEWTPNPKEERKADEVQIDITIANKGEIGFKRIRLNATLPNDTIYKDSIYSNEQDGILNYPTRVENDDATTKMLSWFLGDLQTGQEKKLRLWLSNSNAREFNTSQMNVYAMGDAVGQSAISS
jgi:hypothetical protein